MTISVDDRLLSLLRDNARLSTSELARQLQVSRTTIQSKIKRLEQQGIIEGYSVRFGEAYSKRLVSAHVLIMVHQKLTAQTNAQLRNMPQVSALYAISGDYDLIAVVQSENTQNLSRVLDEIGNLEGVERTNSSLILETKFSR